MADYRNWTDRERAIVAQAEASGLKTRHIRHLLSDRTPTNIQNMFARLRRERRNVCPCGALSPGAKLCPACHSKHKTQREKRKQEGICAACGDPIGEGGSITKCKKCIRKQRRYPTRKKKPGTVNPSSPDPDNPMRWVAPNLPRTFWKCVPEGYQVVDLFGGSGSATLKFKRVGQSVLAYNDVHAGLVAYMRTVKSNRQYWELAFEIERIHRLTTEQQVQIYKAATVPALTKGAATFVLSRKFKNMQSLDGEPQGFPLHSNLPRVLSKHGDLLQGVEITQLDWRQAIQKFDSPKTVFFVDPPWPGATEFEHDINGQHADLIQTLMEAEGEFMGVMAANRATLKALVGVPYIYFYVSYARCVLFSSFPLEISGLQPVKPEDFGIEAKPLRVKGVSNNSTPKEGSNMKKKLPGVNIIHMTPAEWAKVPDHECQRNTAQHAFRAMKSHLKVPSQTHQVVVAVDFKGKRYKADGHTRSFLWQKGALPAPKTLTVLLHEARTREEFRSVYYEHNNKAASKTGNDTFLGVASLEGVALQSKELLRRDLGATISKAMGKATDKGNAHVTYADHLRKYREEILLMDKVGFPYKRFKRGVFIAAFLTFRRYGTQTFKGHTVLEFWQKVVADAGEKLSIGRDGVQMAVETINRDAGRKAHGYKTEDDLTHRLLSCCEQYLKGKHFKISVGRVHPNPSSFRTRLAEKVPVP